MEERRVCSVCGGLLNDDNEMSFDGEIMCERCYEVNTVVCDNCGRRIWRDNAEGDDRLTLCQHCYDECYTNCEDCGRLIHTDNEAIYDDENDYPYCRECYEKLTNQAIKSYNYTPEPIFYGDSKFYFGVELEIDKGGEEHDNAREILAPADGRAYGKHDGSI